MNRLNNKAIALAISLSALAGCVDAIGFLQLGGYFVSFMSGNSTQLAVGLANSQLNIIAELGGIIALFVGGTILGTLIGERMKPGMHVFAVLSLVALLLVSAAICAGSGWFTATIVFMTLAMGAENAALQRDGDVIVGLTYMTGTLVKIGQRIAYAFKGGKKFAWLPYLLLWMGLICGGLIGGLLFHLIGLQSLWIASAWALILAAVTYWKNPFK